ncbi:hypothetical protein [Streptomyces spectabilis]|uniref:Uncharacterized protein n=1 Tax=Streptomyces spectabilis TaxID=68270 RepID=A0A7W8AQ23_STRST|nr:hypothetical protein [Streptomyces spectabilis]MBB5101288.1 hypothetical protein [Streptomyces spectabilis]MCI3900487.1 hypothetical protein [Streptomyces spectabilis]GGV10404.1 hypothetical protein GCM10010245_19640 [Streptomyces spectabilis]
MPSNDVIKGPQADPARSAPPGAAPPPRPRGAGVDPASSIAARAMPGSEGDTGAERQVCAFNRWCTVLY